ncbi:MAG TPA: TetR/AcrR family transcriptional regulator [Bacteroidota bacterium]|nr:TetR/AcrR family transcriptional regulator [Bacteroidota bacterium]
MSPRSKKTAEQMREKSRRAIVLAALELFARKGYSATTADAIARKAGISKGLIYSYFDSKQDILFGIFDEQMDRVFPRFFNEKDARPPHERLVSIINSWLELITNEPLLVRLSLQLNLDDDYRRIIRSKKAMKYYNRFLTEMKKLFSELGSARPDLDTYLLMFLFDGVVANYTVAPDLFPIEEIKIHLVDLLTSRWETK